MVLSRLTKITGPGVSTDTNWVGNNADFTGITTSATSFNIGVTTIHSTLIESHNIVSTGVITATSFSGDGSALTGVANTDFVVGTAITMGTANFTGNVTIGGTLTYEDVTNIDSVGIITTQKDIHVGAGVSVVGIVTAAAGDFDDFVDVGSNIKLGNAGVITATSFVGSGAQLTGLSQSDTPIASSTLSSVFFESDDETIISDDTTLSRASSNSGVIYTKFQQVVVAPTKSLIVDAGETLVVDAYGLRTPDI